MNVAIRTSEPAVDLAAFSRLVARMRKGDPTRVETVSGVAVEVSNNLESDEIILLADMTRRLCAPPSTQLVVDAAQTLFDAYRAPEFSRPEASLALYCKFLGSYPAAALLALQDVSLPDNVIRRCKFLPTMAEIADWLDPMTTPWRQAAQQVGRYLAGLDATQDRAP